LLKIKLSFLMAELAASQEGALSFKVRELRLLKCQLILTGW